MRIELDDVSRPQVLALLEEHLRNMHELSPPEHVFAFDAAKLRQPGVAFWTAWESMLLNHLLQVARERGYRELFLETGNHPESPTCCSSSGL